MKFREIIQSIQSALRDMCDRCLRFFSQRHRAVEKDPRNSENQNPQDSQPKENAETKNKSSKDDKEPDLNSPSPAQTQSSEKTETAHLPEQPPENQTQSENGKNEDSKKQPQTGQDEEKRGKEKPNQTGGMRGKTNQTAENGNRATKSQPPQCRFVCYEETDGRWAIALAVEEGQNAQSVRQGNKKLSANGCLYILEDIDAEVTVEFQGGHPPKDLKLFHEHKFMVFKMRKNWKGEGQKVKTLSSGDYVVFAHESCGQRIGKARTEAAQCRYDDFMVHFFSISKDSEKINDRFKNYPLPFSSAKRFSLKGKSIPDDLGELFGDDAPQLDNDEKWREISWIVIGRENGGKVLAKFRPEEKKTLAEVLGERSGWFFVRIYDANVDLLHSFDFRRAKGLKNIFVNEKPLGEGSPIVPSINGHTKTIVQFEGNLPVHPADDSNGICKVTEKETAFAVSPQHPANDKTKWVLGSGKDCVKAEILLPRIWWKFIEEKGKEGDWQDTPIKMKRQAFRQARNEKIRIRFSFRIPGIVVGFGDSNTPSEQKFPTKLSKDQKTCEAELRLDDFGDYPAIKKPLRKAMDLRVKLKDSDVIFPIVHIPADARPNPKPELLKIEPDIGEGFSRLELERAKEELYQEGWMAAAKAAEEFENFANDLQNDKSVLDMRILFEDVNKLPWIPFDPQRKSMESENVEKLKAFFKKHFEKG